MAKWSTDRSARLQVFINDLTLLVGTDVKLISFSLVALASAYQSHVAQMAGAVQELAVQELKAQILFHSFPSVTKKIFGNA